MKSETRRRSPSEMKKDLNAFEALQNIADYRPAREEASVDAVSVLYDDLNEKRKIETQKVGELKAARDNTVAAEHAFHQAILKVKNEIKSLFGDDSNELQSLGLKKKSEYKKPKRKTKDQ